MENRRKSLKKWNCNWKPYIHYVVILCGMFTECPWFEYVECMHTKKKIIKLYIILKNILCGRHSCKYVCGAGRVDYALVVARVCLFRAMCLFVMHFLFIFFFFSFLAIFRCTCVNVMFFPYHTDLDSFGMYVCVYSMAA